MTSTGFRSTGFQKKNSMGKFTFNFYFKEVSSIIVRSFFVYKESAKHSSSEEELSMDRRDNRFSKEKSSISPKSPRSRFSHFDDDKQQHTPRSPHGSNELDNFNMMATLRKQLNDNFGKSNLFVE